MFDNQLDIIENERWQRRKRRKEQERVRFEYEDYYDDFEELEEISSRRHKRHKHPDILDGDYAFPQRQKGKKSKRRRSDFDY